MSHSISTRLLLLLALSLPVQAAGTPPTWPSKDQLRAVQSTVRFVSFIPMLSIFVNLKFGAVGVGCCVTIRF